MEVKTEEMEAGYDTLIKLEPQDKNRFLEKKKEIIDIEVKAHARLLPAIARCHNPVTANPRHPRHQRSPGKEKRGIEARQAQDGLHSGKVQKVEITNNHIL